MTTIHELASAISAHALWKARLRQAVKTGHIDVAIASSDADTTCEFGKWLQATAFTARGQESVNYAKAKERHLSFHKAAARVARLVMSGKNEEAERLLDFGAEYSIASARLTASIMEWKTFAGARPEAGDGNPAYAYASAR